MGLMSTKIPHMSQLIYFLGTNMKICTECMLEKELGCFTKCRVNKDGLDYLCRQCKSIKNKQQHFKNHEKSLARIRKNYQANAEKRRAYAKQYHKDTNTDEQKAKAIERAKKHYWSNRPEGHRTKAQFHTDLKSKAKGRKVVASKYAHKRRLQLEQQTMSAFDEFVFEEALALAILRSSLTSFKWHVDHIVPLNHKTASGLHVAANFQVVPAYWNVRKSNTSMAEYDFS